MGTKKEIKFTKLSFSEIGVDGFVNHEYDWDKHLNILTHKIDGVIIEKLNETDARKRINELIGFKKTKTQKPNNKEIVAVPPTQLNQLLLF